MNDEIKKQFSQRVQDLRDVLEFWSEIELEENGGEIPINMLMYTNPFATVLILMLKSQRISEKEMLDYMRHGWKIVNLDEQEK